ncbi:MAG TPA: hypothetical protein VNM48_01355 [Chloroflexota bacterium]|nr:hypothetical protein [Chloroflexota bacterium]
MTKKLPQETVHNPDLYHQLSVPFAAREDSNDAVDAFMADVEQAREKHRIADVYVIVETTVVVDGTETQGSYMKAWGSGLKPYPMVAAAYGYERGRFEDRMARIIAAAEKLR